MFWVLVFLVGGGCFTWNMEAYSAAGKNHLHQQAKNKKNMSSSLVLLTSKDHSCAGKLNKLQSPITYGGAE